MDAVDLRGKPCPIPVIEVKKLLAAAAAGSTLTVVVDNDIARQNLQKLAAGLGHGFSHEQTPEGDVRVAITPNAAAARSAPDADAGSGLVVAIGSDRMGSGDETLGRTLMKSFIFSLTELAPAPEHVLFFNAGVHLTCEGSPALDDLRALAAKGVFINSCGACLNYHGKTDKLAVGGVTNMYAIVGTMAQAKRTITL